MSAALAAEPPRKRRSRKPEQPAPAPTCAPRLLNKSELCREALISRPTLDACLARDPTFPVVRRGGGNGDTWQFDADVAVPRIAELLARTEKDLTPNQRFMDLRARELERKQAIDAGGLLVAEHMRGALSRGLTGLRRDLTGAFIAEVAKGLKLTKAQQRLLKGMVEDRLRTFVAGLAQTGLPDADE